MIAVGAEVGGFRIEKELGRGGMGVVYLAEQLNLGRKVALKVMTADLSADPDFADRFTREARLAASLDHQNVVPIFETGSIDGVLYLAMRYVPGTDLRAVLARDGPLSPADAARITEQVAAALDAAHARGLVHRDVKPANVLVAGNDASGHLYLADFGLTKEMDAQSGGLTKTGQFVGTLDYVAPEQIQGERVDARSDVYALGCVLFQMISGRVPYQGSEAHKLWAHLSEPPPSVEDLGISDGARLNTVVQRAMAKAPADRYPSAGDLGRAAIAAASGTPITAPERSVASGAAAAAATRQQTVPVEREPDRVPVTARARRQPSPSLASTVPMGRRKGLSTGWGAVVAGVLLAAAIVGAAVIVASRSSDSGTSTTGTTGSNTGTTGNNKPPLSSWPADESAFTVVLASKRDRASAEGVARRAPANTSPGVLDSDEYPSLNPGYWVAFSGRFSAATDAERAAERLRGSGFSDAYTRYVDASGATPSASASTLRLSRFNTGTDPGESMPAAYCEVSVPSTVYCWTPNDGFTLRLDDTRARRIRGDEPANKNRTPRYQTLSVGLRNSRATITCSSERTRLTCRNAAGAGFSLPRYRGLPTYF
jgi:serine/threonine protein kinase